MSILETIQSPADLQRLDVKDLARLAAEIREVITETVSRNGGHLASNLGTVELSLALHKVFDFSSDRLIWDVGHQCYTHKLITGRRDEFHTLRQWRGLTGFPNRDESSYDPFTSGHAGTSISWALGMAAGDRLAKRSRRVVAVTGDGALASGMAFEALNDAGARQEDVLVILNDNRMSISRSVGALSQHLQRIRVGPLYRDLKREIHAALSKVPVVGQRVERTLEVIKNAVKREVIPDLMFQELGFNYVGPIDGHDLAELIEILEQLRSVRGRILLHVLTEKGRGFEPATADPTKFHSSSPFRHENGQAIPLFTGRKPKTYTDIFSEAILSVARRDERVVAITAAMPDGTGLIPFAKEFPTRFFDVGICEQHAVGLAAGLCNTGMRPIVAIYSTFLQRAFDQVFHDVCLQNLNVVFAIDRAGLVGADGPTHHGLFDIAYLRCLPNLIIAAPGCARDLDAMIKLAIDADRPFAVRYPRCEAWTKQLGRSPVTIGKGEILREGRDVALLALGSITPCALEAAEKLRRKGIEVTVADARFVKPLDTDLVCQLAREHAFLFTLEEGCRPGGFGSAVLECLSAEGVNRPRVELLAVDDKFIPHGAREILLKECGLDVESIVRRVENAMRRPGTTAA